MTKKVDNLCKIKITGSEELCVTPEHPFLCREKIRKWNQKKRKYELILSDEKWVKAKELNKNHRVQILKNKKEELPEWDGVFCRHKNQFGSYDDKYKKVLNNLFENSNFWWIIGRYIGDGWYRFDEIEGRYEFCICCNKKEKDEIRNVLDEIKI